MITRMERATATIAFFVSRRLAIRAILGAEEGVGRSADHPRPHRVPGQVAVAMTGYLPVHIENSADGALTQYDSPHPETPPPQGTHTSTARWSYEGPLADSASSGMDVRRMGADRSSIEDLQRYGVLLRQSDYEITNVLRRDHGTFRRRTSTDDSSWGRSGGERLPVELDPA